MFIRVIVVSPHRYFVCWQDGTFSPKIFILVVFGQPRNPFRNYKLQWWSSQNVYIIIKCEEPVCISCVGVNMTVAFSNGEKSFFSGGKMIQEMLKFFRCKTLDEKIIFNIDWKNIFWDVQILLDILFWQLLLIFNISTQHRIEVS